MSSSIPVSEKNTKSEILKAYEELLHKVQASNQHNKKAEKELLEKKDIIQSAGKQSSEQIVSSLGALKLEIMKALDRVVEQLLEQKKNLSTMQQAIAFESNNLKELHEIRVEADSLAALILGNRDKKAEFQNEMSRIKLEFETEMQEKRASFKKQQESAELHAKETNAKVNKERQREDEEYQYKLKLERGRDEDAYNLKKKHLEDELSSKAASFEKSCQEREAHLRAQENELEELRLKVSSFPERLDKAVKEAELHLSDKLSAQHQYEASLTRAQADGEIKLLKQTIAALEAKVKEKDNLIEQLTQKGNQATLQIQDIAVKAIEGASASRAFQSMFTRPAETEKLNKA